MDKKTIIIKLIGIILIIYSSAQLTSQFLFNRILMPPVSSTQDVSTFIWVLVCNPVFTLLFLFCGISLLFYKEYLTGGSRWTFWRK